MFAAKRNSIFVILANIALSYVSWSLKGFFYLYLLSATLFILIGVIAVIFLIFGLDPISQLLLLFKPILVQLGVPDNISGTIYIKGPISTGEQLAEASFIFSILGFIGTKVIERMQKKQMTLAQEAALLVGLCIAANIAASLVVAGIAFAKLGLQAIATYFIFTFVAMSAFSGLALFSYALSRLVGETAAWISEGKIRIGY